MKSLFLNLKIKWKLLIAFASILLLSLVLVLTGYYTVYKIMDYKTVLADVNALKKSVLELKVNAGQFLNEDFKSKEYQTTGSIASLDAHAVVLLRLQQEVVALEKNTTIQDYSLKKSLTAAQKLINIYSETFLTLEKKVKERGFKDYGVEGQLRAAIHAVEASEYEYNKALMLMLRRHEKDFFLRKDIKYQGKFNDAITELKENIYANALEQDAGLRRDIVNSINSYQEKFNYIVQLEQAIGLTQATGYRGILNVRMHHLEPLIDALTSNIQAESEMMMYRSSILMALLFVFQILIGFVLILFYSKILSNTINEIKQAMEVLAAGRFPKKLIIRSKDELAKTKIAMNNMVARMKFAVAFAKEIGEGELNKAYAEEFENDVLAKAIVSMQKHLQEADEKQRWVNWKNKGMAQFNEILKSTDIGVDMLCDGLLSAVVKYIGANQGALYTLKGDVLTRVSTYAYERKKHITEKIKNGEGLLGQCILEKDIILINQLPDQYTHITSGLGKRTPNQLILVPLQYNEQVIGALELASFENFHKEAIDLLEQLSGACAAVLLAMISASSTEKLLMEMQEQKAMLAEKEETLMQNIEEFTATEEDLKRQNEYLQSANKTLQEKLLKNKQPKKEEELAASW